MVPVIIIIIIIITLHVIVAVVVGVVVVLHACGFWALEARELHEPIIVSTAAAIVQPHCKPSIAVVVAFIAALLLAAPSHLLKYLRVIKTDKHI